MFKTFFNILLLVAQPFSSVQSRKLNSITHSLIQKPETIQKSYDNTDKPEGVNITVASARKYLKAFGYLGENRKMMKVDNENAFDEYLEASIQKFQQYYSLDVTGKLDSETKKLMSSPRCGVADTKVKTWRQRFIFLKRKSKWPSSKRHLTYAFESNPEFVPLEVQRRVFKEAFRQWSRVSPFTFSEARNNGASSSSGSDIRIGFFKGEHGDSAPFEKWGFMLAHAFTPPDGRVHVNEQELWSDEVPIEKEYYDLVWIAMHEIGHVLGLDHSSHDGSIMYAYTLPGVNRKKLSADDVAAIRTLYSSTDHTAHSHASSLFCSAISFLFFILLVTN